MIGKADYQPCCCDPPCSGQIQRPVSRNAMNSGFPAEEYQRYNYPSGYNYKNKKQTNSKCNLNAETLEAFAAVRQRACNNYPGMDLQTMTEPSYKTTSLYPPQRGGADVRRQADMIDYAPESEFLKRMKQQCEYLRNNEENIFTTLDHLGFDDCFPLEQTKPRSNVIIGDYASDRRPASKTSYRQQEGREEKQYSKSARTLYENTVITKKPQSANSFDRKSEHISRSKKPTFYRGRRKRASSEKSESGERFEPTLKRPHEDSCERCWRYASPARSPVNKPDQKYDPNFRKAHSNPDFEKGDGYNQVPSRPQTPQIYSQSYTSREGRRPLTPTASDWQKFEAPSKTKTGLSQNQLMSQKASRRSVAYTSAQPRETRQPQGKENWQTQKEKDMWRPETPVSRQGYEIPNVGPVTSSPRQQYPQTTTRPVKTGVSRSQTKMQDLTYNVAPPQWPENKPPMQQASSQVNYQNYYSAPERPPRPKSCTPGIGHPQGYKSNMVEQCIKPGYRTQFSNAPDPGFQTNIQRQQTRNDGPRSSFVAPGLFCYRDHSPKPCHCICVPPGQQQDIFLPPKCPTDADFEDELGPDGRPPGGRPPGGRPQAGHPLDGHPSDGLLPDGRPSDGRLPDGRPPDGRPPDGRPLGGRSPGGRSPGGRPLGGRSPAGRSQSGRSPVGGPRDGSSRTRRSPSGHGPEEDPLGVDFLNEDLPIDSSPVDGPQVGPTPTGRGRGGRSPGGRPGGRPGGGASSPGARTSPQQTKTGTAKGTPKTPANTTKPGIPHSDSTVYADLPPGRGPDDVSFPDKSPERSRKKGKGRTPSPKGSAKGTRERGKSPKRSPNSPGQKSGRKVSPKSSKSSKSSKSPKSPKSSKSSKSPKSQKISISEEESPKSKRTSPKSRSKSVSSKSPSKSSPKPAAGNLPTSQASQVPANEVICTYEENGRPQTVCADMREYNYASAYPPNKIPLDQFKGTQVIRECCCATRQPRYDDPGNCILCCHCNLNKPYQNPETEPYPAPGPSRTPVNTRPVVQTNNWRPQGCSPERVPPPRNVVPENFNQAPAAQDDDLDDYVNCPYRPKSVRLWQLSDQKKKIPYSSNMGPILESQNYSQPPYGYNVNPKTYFVFHMRKCKPGKGNDVEVLVEETAKTRPNQEDKRTKNMTEKMKKIAECPSDSMALRFQKGVSESCKTLQNSRILYF